MSTLLEQVMPVYHFHEVHHRRMAAPADAVWDALRRVRLDDLRLTQPLVALRHLGARTTPATGPLLTEGPVRLLELREGYAIGGTVARPWQRRPARQDVADLAAFVAYAEPGWTKYLTDFAVLERAGGVELRTETRGYSTDDASRRRFAAYWALIRVPSGLIRRDLLAAVDRLALAQTSRAMSVRQWAPGNEIEATPS